ncbi:MAG: hypothetical protein KGQ59_12070 [Bdellovibrionales bacterium]|nr:hypothetical protein [Bdellovibrionales bacterium]
MPRSTRSVFLAFVVPVLILFFVAWGKLPVNDPPQYFQFADARLWLGIPNAWNVLTNLPFVVVAWMLWKTYAPELSLAYRRPGLWLSAGMLLTAAGSAYFHWDPNPETLFWDRLPMTILFCSVFLLIVSDRFAESLGLSLSYPMLGASIGTILFWRFAQDVRPYIVLQFGLMVFVLLAAIFRRSSRLSNLALLGMGLLYIAAKLLEAKDEAVLHATGGMTAGHALKHLFAAVALAVFARGLRPASPPQSHS